MEPQQNISLTAIFKLAIPIMFSSLAGTLYYFSDRVILSMYSPMAMNSAVLAGNVCLVFQMGLIGLASTTEVFVGQHNGANHNQKIGQSVWQMLRVSFYFVPLAIIFSLYGAEYFLSGSNLEYGENYFKIMALSAPVSGMIAALSGFYLGRKRSVFVMVASIGGNVLNIGLTYLLVLGVPGAIPGMGATGAAIGSFLSQFVIFLILFSDFLRKFHRQTFNTLSIKHTKELWLQLKVGFPSAVSHFVEMGGWTAGFAVIAAVSFKDHTVFSMTQGVLVLFFFMNDGLQKAVATLAANAIGAQARSTLGQLLFKVFVAHLCFMGLLLLPFVIFPDAILWFYDTSQLSGDIISTIHITMRWAFGYLFFDGLFWIFAGLLTAGGDTRTVMVMNAGNMLLFYLVPILLMKHYGVLNVVWAHGFAVLYCVVNCIASYLRYRYGAWVKVDLSKPTEA